MRRRTTWRVLVLVVGLAVVGVVLGYALLVPRGQTAAEPVRIAYLKVSTTLPVFVALEKGFFEKRDLKVEATPLESSTQVVESIIAGRADVGSGLAVQTGLAAWQTAPGVFRIIGLVEFTGTGLEDCIMVKKDSPITRFADLAGKKIAGLPSTYLPVLVQVLAEKNGMPANSVQYVGMAPPLLLDALQAGSVDAVYGFATTCAQGLQLGTVRILLETPQMQVIKPAPAVAVVVSTSFEKARPRTVKAVEDALSEALEYIRKNPDEARTIIGKYIGGGVEKLEVRDWVGYRRAGEISEKNLQAFADFLLQRGLLTKPVDVGPMLRKP